MAVQFKAGDTAVIRYWRVNLLREVRPTRVIEDSQRGLFAWLPAGTKTKTSVIEDGSRPRLLAEQLAAKWQLVDGRWHGPDVIMWFPLNGSAYSVWWFFEEGKFTGWYVNLEDPQIRWADGLDTSDLALDICVNPDRTWRIKDRDEFDERTGHPLYWTADEAEALLVEADRVVELIKSAAFPFDGSWCSFRPPAHWSLPECSRRWNSPRARL